MHSDLDRMGKFMCNGVRILVDSGLVDFLFDQLQKREFMISVMHADLDLMGKFT